MNKKIKFFLVGTVILVIIFILWFFIVINNYIEKPPKYPSITCIDDGKKILGIVDVCRQKSHFNNESRLGFTLIKVSDKYNLEEAYVEYFDYSGEFLDREEIKAINHLNLNNGVSGFGFNDNPEVMKIAISSKINKDGNIIDCGMSQIFEVKDCYR
jgi:PDZ domain-containing secreted protein